MKRRRKRRTIAMRRHRGVFRVKRSSHKRRHKRVSGLLGGLGSMFGGLGNFNGLLNSGIAAFVVRFLVTFITDFMTKKDATGKPIPDPNPSRFAKYIPLGLVYFFGEKYLHIHGLRTVAEVLLSLMFLQDFVFSNTKVGPSAGLSGDVGYDELQQLAGMSDDALLGLGYDPGKIKEALLSFGTPGSNYLLGQAGLNAPYAV